MALIFFVSLSAKACITCLVAWPNEHRPCKIGSLNPPIAANEGSIWRGFKSPLNLYNAAWLTFVFSSTTFSGGPSGFLAVAYKETDNEEHYNHLSTPILIIGLYQNVTEKSSFVRMRRKHSQEFTPLK